MGIGTVSGKRRRAGEVRRRGTLRISRCRGVGRRAVGEARLSTLTISALGSFLGLGCVTISRARKARKQRRRGIGRGRI